ncbi:MAG: terminase gpA endonuclease subunit [Marinagarivorans sp.]|nr:terminase gpA endonuclease subunit [Marinagarivorans sp.]
MLNTGGAWLSEMVGDMVEEVLHLSPVEFIEQNRYLPNSVSALPGPFSFSLTPFMREIVNNADQRVDVQEINVMKGVQISYTTMLECALFYYAAFIKTAPCMMISADRELVKERVENCILPMLEHSGFADIIQSSDTGNGRKTGKTSNHLQWQGGGFLIPGGANNANKMRMWSIQLMLKDEVDAWPDLVGKDGDPDKLTDARCDTFNRTKKIYRGGTPLVKGTSKIHKRFLEGDQREYHVPCKHCGKLQSLRWSRTDKETGEVSGFVWGYGSDGLLDTDTVRYLCMYCGGAHYEYDKPVMFAAESGAKWVAHSAPKRRGVRSYKLPAFYSPYGFRPWSQCVQEYLDAFDPATRTVTDYGRYQVFYNNVLAEPFEISGDKIRFSAVSAHRRSVYRCGEIPNGYAAQYSGSKIHFLTCQVDVQKRDLAVAVMGWTDGARPYIIDYQRMNAGEDCGDINDPVWQKLRTLIEETTFTADDGIIYNVAMTLVDAGYCNDTVTQFCSDYGSGVYPILGRDRPAKNASIKEFSQFKTQTGTTGYKVVVDHYKDRMAVSLRRDWREESGDIQPEHHLNAPTDLSDKSMRELIVESRKKKIDPNGSVSYPWYRPGNVDNELFDLLGYGFACVDILAWGICVEHFEMEQVTWPEFWTFAANPENDGIFGRAR